jgi:hypothetical protein
LLVVDRGASAQFFEALELSPSEAGPVRLGVAPPGAAGFPQDQPAIFEWGGSVTHQGSIECGPPTGASPPPVGPYVTVTSSKASLSADASTWSITETMFLYSYDYNRDVSKLVNSGRVADVFIPAGTDTLTLAANDPRVQQYMAGNSICGAPVSA